MLVGDSSAPQVAGLALAPIAFFLLLEEPKQERKRNGAIVKERKINISRNLVPTKEKFIFLFFVFS
jgi:hypothetical protein